MTEETLDTVADNLEDITIDSSEGKIFDGLGNEWSSDNPLPVTIVTEPVNNESSEQETEIKILGQETEADPVILEDINVYSAKSASRSGSDFKNLWKLEISGNEYSVLFPVNANLSVVDGKLYNTGSSSVTGLIMDSSFSDSTYADYTITVLPVTSSSTQSTVHRYGSRIYLTHYSTATSSSLQTTVSYIQPIVKSRPVGFSFTTPELVISGLLLLSCLISIVGGLFRR